MRNDDIIKYQGDVGVVSYIGNENIRLDIRGNYVYAQEEDIEAFDNSPINTHDYAAYYYAMRVRKFSLKSNVIHRRCMEYPSSLTRTPRSTIYFTGLMRKEVFEFIEYMNSNYSFVEISLVENEPRDVTGVSKQGFYHYFFLGEGDTWNRCILKIKLRHTNNYVLKLLCVIIRSYFYGERYDRVLLLQREEIQGDVLGDLQRAINLRWNSYHYFSIPVDLGLIFGILEDMDFTNIDSIISSQTQIYKDIFSERGLND